MGKGKCFVGLVILAIGIMLSFTPYTFAKDVPLWPVTLFEDDFEQYSIGTKWDIYEWSQDTNGNPLGPGNSKAYERNGRAEFEIEGPISGAYLVSKDTNSVSGWSSVNFSGKWGVGVPGTTAAFDMFIFNANNPSKFYQVYISSWGGPFLGFYDSGSDKGSIAGRSFPVPMTDFSMRFTNTGFEYWENGSLVKSFTSDAMDGATAFKLKIGGWDYSQTTVQEVYFDDIKVTAAPEPISSALFLLGGGAMAVMRARKKRS